MIKMYILIKESIDPGHSIVAAAHASLGCYLKFKDHQDTKEWLDKSFRKVICKVSEEEFENSKEFDDFVVITESSLDNKEVAIAFRPRNEWPKAFKFYKLWK